MPKSTSTARSYESYIRDFEAWCTANGFSARPAPPEAVAGYFVLRGQMLAASSMRGRLAAIKQWHQDANLPDPTSEVTWSAVRSLMELAAPTPIDVGRTVPKELWALLSAPAATAVDTRDTLIALLIAGAGLNRSEVVALRRDDVSVSGSTVTVVVGGQRKRSVAFTSSDPEVLPHRILAAWIELLPSSSKTLLTRVSPAGVVEDHGISVRSVNVALHRRATSAGLDPEACTPEALRPIPRIA